MASVTMAAMSLPSAGLQRSLALQPLGPLPRASAPPRRSHSRLAVRASLSKEQAVAGIALAAALVIPEVAEAAQPGMSPSLKNFLLSIVSGGVVLGVLFGAVIGVSNFDPVKRT